jgi:hypothetical protein
MPYFTQFPQTVYEFNGKTSYVRDIFLRTTFISEYKPYTDLFSSYTILDGETPQNIANKLYGSVNYHWVVLLFNEIHNPYYDWPLDQLTLETYCRNVYGDTTMYMTRHYEKGGLVIGEIKEFVTGITWVPVDNPGPLDPLVYPVSFIEHETRLNDDKRKIQLLRPELLGEFVRQHEEAING